MYVRSRSSTSIPSYDSLLQSENGQFMVANPLKASSFTINNLAITQSA
jgi:hypothetical protein